MCEIGQLRAAVQSNGPDIFPSIRLQGRARAAVRPARSDLLTCVSEKECSSDTTKDDVFPARTTSACGAHTPEHVVCICITTGHFIIIKVSEDSERHWRLICSLRCHKIAGFHGNTLTSHTLHYSSRIITSNNHANSCLIQKRCSSYETLLIVFVRGVDSSTIPGSCTTAAIWISAEWLQNLYNNYHKNHLLLWLIMFQSRT